MAGFFRSLVNRINNRAKEFLGGAGAEEEGPPEPPWTPGEPPPPPPPIEVPEAPDDSDQVSIYTQWGDYIGTHDWEGWWNASVKNTYAGKIHVLNLIQLIEDEYDIDWDWKAWREAYAAAHSAV